MGTEKDGQYFFYQGSVVAQEYNESWLVMSVISVDMCDCIYTWLAPWLTHSCPCIKLNLYLLPAV
jgi:hypothetical protein